VTTTQNIPRSWRGSPAEWAVFNALQGLGKALGRDFTFEANPEDGVAFRFTDPPDLGINVVGLMQNYATGQDGSIRSVMAKQQLMGLGVHLIFIEDVDLAQDPSYYVQEALNYRDHSHMGS